MSKRRLSVLVDSNAREAAKAAGLPLYEWTQRAIMRAAAAESFERFVQRLLLRPDNSHAWPHLLARVLYVPGMCAAIAASADRHRRMRFALMVEVEAERMYNIGGDMRREDVVYQLRQVADNIRRGDP